MRCVICGFFDWVDRSKRCGWHQLPPEEKDENLTELIPWEKEIEEYYLDPDFYDSLGIPVT